MEIFQESFRFTCQIYGNIPILWKYSSVKIGIIPKTSIFALWHKRFQQRQRGSNKYERT